MIETRSNTALLDPPRRREDPRPAPPQPRRREEPELGPFWAGFFMIFGVYLIAAVVVVMVTLLSPFPGV